MKKIIAAVMFLLILAGNQFTHATETTETKTPVKPLQNETQLDKLRTVNPSLWALLKDIQNFGNIANLNIKELEDRFNRGQPFLPTNDMVDVDLQTMNAASYYTDYVSSYNAAKYYLTVRAWTNNYPIVSDQKLSVHLNITPSSNQCIKIAGLAFVFDKDTFPIVPTPPHFTAQGSTEEEKLASIKKFQDYHRIYRPSIYVMHKSDSQPISFGFATNGCLLSVYLSKN